jgi:hypothetical protein
LANEKSVSNIQDVDIDDIEVVILIVAKSPPKITQAANFLSRRGWPTTVLSNLSQAIEFATDRKPDFVLISINHPNPAIHKFSELLSSTFGSTCVGFAENNDTASASRLTKSAIPAKIQGQASGPNLHRSLRKLLAEKLNIQLDDKGQSTAERSASANNVTVKGEAGATANKGPTMIKGEAHESAADPKFENESISSGKYTMTKKNRRTLKELSQNPLDKPGDVVMGENKDLAAELKRSLFGDRPETAVPDVAEESETENGAGIAAPVRAEGPRSISRQTAPPESSSSSSQGPAYMPDHSAKPETGHAGAIGHPGYAHGKTPAVTAQASAAVAPKEAEAPAPVPAGPYAAVHQAVQAALEKICRPKTGAHAPIRIIEQVGVFPVDSPNLPGYLVLAWPHEEMRAIEPFFKSAQKILQATFTEMGVKGKIEPGFFVTLPQVDFGPWAQDEAAFSFSTSHGNEEIGVAFFATNRPIPKPKQIDDKTMYSIGLESISTEQPVNFKVYLHMKKNKKYFLYLRNGRQLQPEQKQRLEGKQIKDLYMKTIDVENLRMFLASCHLRQRVKKAG